MGHITELYGPYNFPKDSVLSKKWFAVFFAIAILIIYHKYFFMNQLLKKQRNKGFFCLAYKIL